tara:strand:- start:243 stop:716 length:474 start_codon:yes stop_codon:yes gene_type:complete
MLNQYQDYLTFENIYLWTNFGILPFWITLIAIPNSRFSKIFINSIIIPLILSATYFYVVYQAVLFEESFFNIFKIYLSLENLQKILSIDSFLVIFWIHFLALNLFLGCWVSRDGIKYNVSRPLVIISLILIYFIGPIGLVFYWLFRIFFAKKLGFHE